jgi:hypothetical protein
MPNTLRTKKKITRATVKAFIRRNEGRLFISTRSRFDGMTDGVESCRDQSFSPALKTDAHHDHNLGIAGAWFVGQSRDLFRHYDDGEFEGIDVCNDCGSFVLAVKKNDT